MMSLSLIIKPSYCWQTKISRNTAVQKEKSNQYDHNWKVEVQLSDMYSAYSDNFIKILTQFEAMWVEHLSRINMA